MSFRRFPVRSGPIPSRNNGAPHEAGQPATGGRPVTRTVRQGPAKRSSRACFVLGLMVSFLAGFMPTPAQQGASAAPGGTPPGGPPRLVLDNPEIDLGPIARGELAQADFVLRNAGGRLLTLRAVEPG